MPAALQTIRWSKVLTTFLLAIMGLLFIMPFLWMISASFKVEADVLKFPIEWIPATWNAVENYTEVWFGAKPFALYYWNSIKVAVLTTFGSAFFSCLAAYAFAKISFKGRDALFLMMFGKEREHPLIKADGSSNMDDPLVRSSLQLRYDLEQVDQSSEPYANIISQKLN